MTDRGLKPKHLKEPLDLVRKEVENLLGLLERGGEGSGHFGHSGRPGEVGGSQAGKGAREQKETSITEKFEKSLEKIGRSIDVWQMPIAASAWITSSGKLYVVNYSHQSALSLAWTRDVERDLTGEQRQGFNDWARENYWSEEFDPGLLYYYFLSKLKWVRVIAERTSHTGTNLSRLNVNLSRDISRSAARTLKDLTLYYESEYDNEPLFDFVDEAFEKREGTNELFSAIGVTRHYGPGPHSGTGTSQDVHGGGAGSGKKKLSRSGAQSVAVTSPKRVAPCLRKLLTNEEIELWHQGMTRGMRSFSPRRVRDESFDESWIGEDGLVYKLEGRTHDSAAMEGMENTRIVYRENVIGGTVAALHTYAEMVTNMLGWLRLSGSRFESAISFHVDAPPTDEQVFSAMHMIAKGGADKLEEFHWEGHNFRISEDGWALSNDPVSGVGAISFYKWLEKNSPAVARSLWSIIERHYGPGPHSGTGSPQSVHGGNGSPASNVMSSADAHKFKGTLFHGTHRKHLQSVGEVGLVPGIGPMVEWAYGEYMDEAYNHPTTGESMIPELLYFTGPRSPEMGTQDDSSIAKAFAFVRHSISYDKYDGDSSKVTWEDIREHGLLVAVGKDDLPGGLYLRGDNEEFYEVNLDWDTEQVGYTELPYFDQYHTGPEPGDYFTPHGVSATMVIYGDELVRLGKALESKWPEAMLAGQMLLPLEFRNLIVERHHGPGPHSGTGSPQSVHGNEAGVELKFRPIDYSFDQTGLISAWIDGEQVGSLAFGAPTKSKYFGEYDVELGWVVVPEEHRRKGIATAMMDEFYRQFEGKRIVPYDTTEAGDAFMKAYVNRHYGPGPHPGTGSPQSVHGRQTTFIPISQQGILTDDEVAKTIMLAEERFGLVAGSEMNLSGRKSTATSFWVMPDGRVTENLEAHAQLLAAIENNLRTPNEMVLVKHVLPKGFIRGNYFKPSIFDPHTMDKRSSLSFMFDPEALNPKTKMALSDLYWQSRIFEGKKTGDTRITIDFFEGEGANIDYVRTYDVSEVNSRLGFMINRHYGPGPHKGTGSPQSVHGGGSGAASPAQALYGRANRLDKNIDYIEDFIDKYSDAPIEHAYIWDEENPDYFREAVGTTDEIDISAYFVRGRTAIHNHPMGVGILSHQDFQFLMYHDMREMMVIANTPEYGKTRSSMRLKKPITPEGFAFGKDLFKIEDAFLAKSTELAKDYKLGEKISPASNVKLWISHMDTLYRWVADEYPEYFEYYSEGFPA